MPSYKLYYFNGRGRAEIARLLFTLKGMPFEDIRKGGEDWAKFKPQTPFGQMPVLEVDGKMYGQSIAIANYLAKEFGYYGSNAKEALEIDQVVQLVADFLSAAAKAFYEKDETKKAELMKNFQEVEVKKYMGFFKDLLAKNKSGYFVGNSITLADLAVFDFVTGMDKRMPGMLSNYPEVNDLCTKVLKDNPRLKAYIDNRPDTPF